MAPILRRRNFLMLGGCAFPIFRSLDAQSALPAGGKLETGDDFLTEKYHEQIAAMLAEWSAGLLESPPRTQAIENVLSPGFLGTSLRPAESSLVRSGPM